MTTTKNTLPLMTAPEDSNLADLPPHAINLHTGECIYCGENPYENWKTFEEYVAWWLENEYEGEPGHTVRNTKEEWDYLHKTCLS